MSHHATVASHLIRAARIEAIDLAQPNDLKFPKAPFRSLDDCVEYCKDLDHIGRFGWAFIEKVDSATDDKIVLTVAMRCVDGNGFSDGYLTFRVIAKPSFMFGVDVSSVRVVGYGRLARKYADDPTRDLIAEMVETFLTFPLDTSKLTS